MILDWDGTLADTQERNYPNLSTALAPPYATIDRDWYARAVGLRHHRPHHRS